MKNKRFLKKATNSFVGRILRRLVGEETGTVMMEYIVIGLLIAAVAVVAIGYFGNGITSMFTALNQVVAAQPTAAGETVTQVKTDANSGVTASQTHTGVIHTNNGTAQDAGTTTGQGW